MRRVLEAAALNALNGDAQLLTLISVEVKVFLSFIPNESDCQTPPRSLSVYRPYQYKGDYYKDLIHWNLNEGYYHCIISLIKMNVPNVTTAGAMVGAWSRHVASL